MKKESLLDTGFSFATIAENDARHQACKKVYEKEFFPLLPDVVLPELSYLILRELEVEILTKFLRSVANGNFELVRTTEN